MSIPNATTSDESTSNDNNELSNKVKDAITNFFFFEPEQKESKNTWNLWGILLRMLQTAILMYTLVDVLIIHKLYEKKSGFTSTVFTQLTGIVTADLTPDQLKLMSLANGYGNGFDPVLSAPDYVLPDKGISVENATCSSDSDCPANAMSENGRLTGKCVEIKTTKTCEIQGWCPVPENADNSTNQQQKISLPSTADAKVMITNKVRFTEYSEERQNKETNKNCNYFDTCEYNENNGNLCPVFRLADIVQNANENYSSLTETGGVIVITITWHCNLNKKCHPAYTFFNLDDKNVTCTQQYSSIYVTYSKDWERFFYNTTGIHFYIKVEGYGYKFNFQLFMTNIITATGSCKLANTEDEPRSTAEVEVINPSYIYEKNPDQ